MNTLNNNYFYYYHLLWKKSLAKALYIDTIPPSKYPECFILKLINLHILDTLKDNCNNVVFSQSLTFDYYSCGS